MSAQLQLHAQRRPMTLRDVDAVMAVENSAYSFPWSRGNVIDSLAAGYVAQVLDHAEAGVIGYFIAMPGVDELHLLNVTVAPGWQGLGHGRRLMDAVREQALVLQAASLWLEVRESNRRARAVYQRLGFSEAGRRRGYYPAAGGREDAIVMRLAVPLVQEKPHALD